MHMKYRDMQILIIFRTTRGFTEALFYKGWLTLATVIVSLVPTSSSRRWCLFAYQRNKHRHRIVATQNEQQNNQ